MITASLLLNIAILIPVCTGLLVHAEWAESAYGAETPGRNILLALYLAIAVASAVFLVIDDVRMVAALLLVQVIYKVLTPVTVGMIAHPVVLTNLGVAAFHTATLFVVWRSWP